ncbi:serpin B11-like [Tiliqua scincoides]|uniref:serpin B11-like n=1 Tax=Tiliqua scincoides TaxID=71010 RepID=UPI0034630127
MSTGVTSFKMSSLSAAISEFGLSYIRVQDENKNIIYSPINVLQAMAALLKGARGETAAQMEKVLHFNEVQSARTGDSSATEPKHDAFWLIDAGSQCDEPGGFHSQFHTLLSQLSQLMKDYDLSIVNRLYGAIGFDYSPHYLRCIKELYNSELERVDFGMEMEKTRLQINDWVETHGKIKEFFSPGNLEPDSALVLVNATYFKGKWKFGFEEKNTIEAPFWVNKNESKNVPMMVQTGMFNYVSTDHPPLQVLELPYEKLELPYEKDDLSMFILLPGDTGDGHFSVVKLASSLTCKQLTELCSPSNMPLQKVTVHLPRFKLEEESDLKESLRKMEMTLPFDRDKADFSGISQKHLFVSQAIHKSFVEFNESGTEGGAVSGAVELAVLHFDEAQSATTGDSSATEHVCWLVMVSVNGTRNEGVDNEICRVTLFHLRK